MNEVDDSRPLPSFQLRPNKFVDRMMFVDAVARVIGEQGPQAYCYISMGATFLSDHQLIYRRTGIADLWSFTNSKDDLRRQKFNRPTAKMRCLEFDSAEMADRLGEMRGDKRVILWLDFMSTKDRRLQFQQTEEVVKKLEAGDVLRVTLNADYRSFGSYNADEKKKHASMQAKAATRLKSEIGDYLEAGLEELTADEMPKVLADAIGVAVENGMKNRQNLKALPLLATLYADGARMLTVAFIIVAGHEPKVPVSLRKWTHWSETLGDIWQINVPDLSRKEKYLVDGLLDKTPSKMYAALPFKPKDEKAVVMLKETIASYKRFHRYYPDFHHLDV